MAEIQKICVPSSAVNKPLALARQGIQKSSEGMEKLQLAEKVKTMKEHPIATKIMDKAIQCSIALWALLGLVLIIHGAQFKNLYLCTMLINAFYYDRVKCSVISLCSSFTTAAEKMKADEPQPDDPLNPDAKAEAKSKHAEKRAAKKNEANPEKQMEEDVAAAKKALKAMDSEKLSSTVFEVLSAGMACHMVMHTHLGQAIVLAHDLVKFTKEKLEQLIDFTVADDLGAWTDAFLSFFLYTAFMGLALIAAPLAMAFDVSSFGAKLALENGVMLAQKMGKIADADVFLASKKGLMVLAGFTAFGTLWQFWSLMAVSGIAWYFYPFYFPALILETIVGCL